MGRKNRQKSRNCSGYQNVNLPDTDQIDTKYNHGITVAYMLDIAKEQRDTKV